MQRQALEAYKCLDERVLNPVEDGDIGSVLGWVFPICTGWALSYVDFVGMQQFVNDCDEFAQKLGPRWTLPQCLRDLTARGKTIYDYKKSDVVTTETVH